MMVGSADPATRMVRAEEPHEVLERTKARACLDDLIARRWRVPGTAIGAQRDQARKPHRVCTMCINIPRHDRHRCEACKGLGRVRMTKREMRREYSALRAASGMAWSAFDDAVRARLREGAWAGEWLTTARAYAREAGGGS